MASGIPSRRRQISTTAAASSALSIEKRGATAAGAFDEQIHRGRVDSPLRSSEGTGHTCSSATPSPSRARGRRFLYWSDDGDLLALRVRRWKVVFAEQRHTGMAVWREPFAHLRWPKVF